MKMSQLTVLTITASHRFPNWFRVRTWHVANTDCELQTATCTLAPRHPSSSISSKCHPIQTMRTSRLLSFWLRGYNRLSSNLLLS
jgi:hypothetical protein